MGNRTDNHTVSPDITMEAQIKFHGMYEYICLSGPLWTTCQDHGIIRGLNGATPNFICEYTRPIKEFHNQGFIHGPAHTVADWTVDTKPGGISHSTSDEGSPELANGTEHVFSRIKPDNEHPKAGYEIPSKNNVNEEVNELVVLVTDVDDCNQTSGPNTWRHKMRVVSSNEDTQDSFYSSLEDGPLPEPEHVGLRVQFWIEPQYKRTRYKNIQDTSGQHHKGIGRDHKEIEDKVIHDEVVHGDLEGSSPCHLRHTGTDDKHRETVDTRYQRLEDKLLPKHIGFDISHWAEPRHSSSQFDTNIGSFRNNGDGSLPLTTVSTLKNPGVKYDMTDSDPRAQRLTYPPSDRAGFTDCEWIVYRVNI